jgi:hypothetical protein
MSTQATPLPDRGYHNITQLSDAVIALENSVNATLNRETTFLSAQVQPLGDRITALEKAVADLAAAVKTLKG